jgi:acyl-CoA reductase-like NAD-dependent aldehyde dehydrogenase
VNIITDANDLGPRLTTHPDVAKIGFTGSSETGKRIMASAADTMKRVTLEMGGNDPAIVLPDVDVKAAAEKVYGGAFLNAGQVCLAVKRAYVHSDIYEDFCAELAALAEQAVVDDGMKQGTTIGPILPVIRFDDIDDVISRANASDYGLGGSVHGRDTARATEIAGRIESGTIWVNQQLNIGPHIPMAGFKGSGLGVEQSVEGLAEYTQMQVINVARG